MTERAETAYATYRGGFRTGDAPPHWLNLLPWVRDAIRVAYLQGKADGSSDSRTGGEDNSR